MERTGYPTAASAARHLCVWPASAMLLALTLTAGPAHALLEGGSSAPLPKVETSMTAPEPELWLTPTAHAREAWRRAVCIGPGYPVGDMHFGGYARSASGTLVPAAMTAAVLPDARPRLVRPVRRPSYVLAAHLIPRDPATVRPVRRPLPEPVMVARMWQGPVVRTAGFGSAGLSDGLWGGSSSIALWRDSLCDDADGATTMGGFGPVTALLPADTAAVPTRFTRPSGRDRGAALTPTALLGSGGGGGGGGGGGYGGQPNAPFPPLAIPPGDPAFPPGPGDEGGPWAGPQPPGPGVPPNGPPIDPGTPPPAADPPAPVPLPAPLLLLLTACAALVLRRQLPLFRRRA